MILGLHWHNNHNTIGEGHYLHILFYFSKLYFLIKKKKSWFKHYTFSPPYDSLSPQRDPVTSRIILAELS